jgi:pyruvate carboxylase
MSLSKNISRHFGSISKILAANRGEIAIRLLRAGTEANLRTVAVYSSFDGSSPHRYKADEAYQLGTSSDDPLAVYLDIPNIVRIAKENGCDAIHPGYGFLSESAEFAKAVTDAGITFVGPRPETIALMGDKVAARTLAKEANVPLLAGSETALASVQEVRELVEKEPLLTYPLMFKAAHGGGGRGMRIVHSEKELESCFAAAHSEALAAFGNGELFVEKYVPKARHIEVQILADSQGNVVHLFERDCSVQRRHQKVVEIAPAISLEEPVRQAILADAVRLAKAARYENAGTVEFLLDTTTGQHYFIEVNARLQVEHTVTEEVTGVDLVQAQFAIAQGKSLADIGISSQADVVARGFAIQCRITTEDASQNFIPDTGTIVAYREAHGFGVRLDAGNAYAGAVVSPHYDSLLTKLTTRGLSFELAIRKMLRALAEFRIRGVTTNLSFLSRVIGHPAFVEGGVTTDFIEMYAKDLLIEGRASSKNRAGRIVDYLAYVAVNKPLTPLGLPDADISRAVAPVPTVTGPPASPTGPSLKAILEADGPVAFAKAVRARESLLLTDTTMRDAHQSLLATRVRTYDLARVAEPTATALANAYSLEVWGGATFDVAMRFLHEDPWHRLRTLRELIPDVPLQMLLRGANAVGYTAYPDNVVFEFCRLARKNGIDIFRVFDSLNDLDNMKVGCEAVHASGGVLEVALCYTGLQEEGGVYTMEYYLATARRIVDELRTHVLAVKDMAGLLTPADATRLIGALRAEFPDLPIHVHTHDTAGCGVAAMVAAGEAGADAVDAALDSMSGMTSQPSMGAIAACLRDSPLAPQVTAGDLAALSEYWEVVRAQYAPFEATATMRSCDSSVLTHQIPGGQLTNLHFQSHSLGLGSRFGEVKRAYTQANHLLGDIIKVTPSSKVVGDFAQFMTSNNLTADDVLARAGELDFPSSVVDYFRGGLGSPPGGFPEPLRSKVLRDLQPYSGRPGDSLPPVDFEEVRAKLAERHVRLAATRGIQDEDVMSSLMYPDVFTDFADFRERYTSSVWGLPTWAFWKSLRAGESVNVELEHGKDVHIKMHTVGGATGDGHVEVFMEMNGMPRTVFVEDDRPVLGAVGGASTKRRKATGAPGSVGAPMPGKVVEVAVKVGDAVEKGDKLAALSAMKMHVVVSAPVAGIVRAVEIEKGDELQNGDLVVELE